MADNPIKTNLPADLPEDWQNPMTVTANGEDSGLSTQHGYNYLMKAVNDAQTAIVDVGNAFETLPALDPATNQLFVNEIPTDLDYQTKTNQLPSTLSLTPEDRIPLYSFSKQIHESVSILNLKNALGVQSTQIEAITNDGVSLTCVNGTTTLTGTGTTTFNLPNLGTWVVTATSGSITRTESVDVTGVLKYQVDLRLASSLAVTTPPIQTSYINGDPINVGGAVVTVTYIDNTTENVTYSVDYSPSHASDGLTQVTFTITIGGTPMTATTPITVDRLQINGYPSQSGSLTYTGTSQTPVWSNYDSAQMVISGTRTATSAGTYTATFTPGSRYKWPDGSFTGYGAQWTIGKAAGTSSVSPSSLSLTPSALAKTFTITKNSTGTTTVSSSNTAIATVSLSGSTATVTARGNGTATIYVNVAADNNYTAPTQKTVSVNAQVVDPNLENNTWYDIQRIARSGTAQNVWSVGDRKYLPMTTGTFQGPSDSNNSWDWFYTTPSSYIYATIVSFNHNAGLEGANSIVFGIFKGYSSASKNVVVDFAFTSAYGEIEYYGPGQDEHWMFSVGNSASGGSTQPGNLVPRWENAQFMRFLNGDQYIRTDGNGIAYYTGMAALFPQDMWDVIKNGSGCTKYTCNAVQKVGTGYDPQAIYALTVKSFYSASEYEILGTTVYSNSVESQYQSQFDYFRMGNALTAFYTYSGGAGTNNTRGIVNCSSYPEFDGVTDQRYAIWWTRSPTGAHRANQYGDVQKAFCCILLAAGTTTATASSLSNINRAIGIVPFFTVR